MQGFYLHEQAGEKERERERDRERQRERERERVEGMSSEIRNVINLLVVKNEEHFGVADI